MTRAVIAARSGTYHLWGSDSGGPGYSFGRKDMLASEHIRSVTLPGGAKLDASRRLYNDALALEMADGAEYPAEIEVTIETRAEGLARLRAETAA